MAAYPANYTTVCNRLYRALTTGSQSNMAGKFSCEDSRGFLSTHFSDLEYAWHVCHDGRWMAWWLYSYLGVRYMQVPALKAVKFSAEDLESNIAQEWADLLRKHFDCYGRRIKQPKRTKTSNCACCAPGLD